MENNKPTNKNNFKNAICYIPLVAVFLFFAEDKKSDELNKNIKYGIFLLITYIVLQVFLGWIFGSILAFTYFVVSGFLGYKAYNGLKVDLEVFDKIEKNIKKNMNDKSVEKTKKTTEKKDDDVLDF